MRLYFNGCSHTYGDDLSDLSLAWPALVAKELNCKFLNDSISGGTNDRIVYQTIKNHSQFDKFYIAWTYTSRFTRYRNDNNHQVNFNSELCHNLYGNSREFKEYGKLHYAFWNNELFNFKLWLQSIILLQRFFDSIKKPYVMINSTDNLINRWCAPLEEFNASISQLVPYELMDDKQLLDEHTEIQDLLSQINYNHYYGWNRWCITDLHQKYPLGDRHHLLEDGHRAVAEYILQNDSN